MVTLANWPRIVRRTVRTSPAPPQVRQVEGWVPGSHPEPRQRSHSTGIRSSTGFVAPNTASSRSRTRWTSASGPRARPAGPRAPPNPAPKKASNRSETPKSNPPAPGPAPAPKPSPPYMS